MPRAQRCRAAVCRHRRRCIYQLVRHTWYSAHLSLHIGRISQACCAAAAANATAAAADVPLIPRRLRTRALKVEPREKLIASANAHATKKVLGPRSLVSIGIGLILGSGIYVTTGNVAQGTAGCVLWRWARPHRFVCGAWLLSSRALCVNGRGRGLLHMARRGVRNGGDSLRAYRLALSLAWGLRARVYMCKYWEAV